MMQKKPTPTDADLAAAAEALPCLDDTPCEKLTLDERRLPPDKYSDAPLLPEYRGGSCPNCMAREAVAHAIAQSRAEERERCVEICSETARQLKDERGFLSAGARWAADEIQIQHDEATG